MEKILEAVNISYVYKGKYQQTQVLNGVTCSFEKGKMYALKGKSGSGKSTFLSLLAGLDVPTEGILYVNGKNIREIDRDTYRKNQVSVIYQAFHLFPLLTVFENVMFPLKLKRVAVKEASIRAEQLLKMVDLPETIYMKFPSMISGGEQQRVAIARAVASGGGILLADEPTGNLDSINEDKIVKILKRLAHNEGYAVIVVTHNERIAGEADKVYEMFDGTIAEVVDE